MSVMEILDEIRSLSLEDRKLLMKLVADMPDTPQPPKQRSLMELEGLGAEIWQGIDAQAYVNQLRSEWDDRP